MGYGSPLGSLALSAGYYPVRWFGIEGAFAPPFGAPPTVGESIVFAWPQTSWLEQGLGIGLAQSFVSATGPGVHPGAVSYLTADCGHLTFYFSRALSLRVAVDLSFALSGRDFCEAHDGACPRTTGISGDGTLFWSFDLGGGAR